MNFTLRSRVAVEFTGTAFLLMAVVGSGIMAERLCAGNVGLALLANSVATGAALVALILALGPISGAHLNPVVTWLMRCSAASRGAKCRSTSRLKSREPLPEWQPRTGCLACRYFLRSSCAQRLRSLVQRVHRDVRTAGGDLGLRTKQRSRAIVRGLVCRGGLHCRGLLVYVFDVVRQSCRDAGARRQ